MCWCMFSHQFASAFFKKQWIVSASLRVAFIVLWGCVHILWSNLCLPGELDWQRKSWWPAMPVVEAGCGRWRVLSRQYEAYVRDQCWTVEISKKGGRALRAERGRDYWGLDALTTGRMAAHHTHPHTHTHTHQSYFVLSQAVHIHTQSSRGCMQSPMLIRLSSSSGGSVRSFVSKMKTGNKSMALEPLQAVKCLQLQENRVVEIKAGQVDVPW